MFARFSSFRFPFRSPLSAHFPSIISASALRGVAWSLLCAVAAPMFAQTPVPVLTWRYDLTHAGQNTSETALTPSNVNPNNFGKLFAMPVDTTVYAQPLYVPGLKMSDGQTHNVIFVATENDSVYAFDADSNTGANASPIWQISLLTPAYGAAAGATAQPWQDTGSPDVAPTVGVTGTPVINLATNTMYLVSKTKENGAYFSRLHAIDITTGKEKANGHVNITASVAGTGDGGTQVTFSPLWQNQRTALNYYNGHVYFGYAAHGDITPWHGWLFSYDATTLQQTSVLCLEPNDSGGGVWGSGAGMPIDTNIAGGRMFVVTGNGDRTPPPFTSKTDFGQSVVAISLANGQLTPTDEWTAFNNQILNHWDLDQGSGGVLMLPDQPGANPHLLITAGKESRITVLNRDNLGGYAAGASSNTNAVQDIPPAPPLSPTNCAPSTSTQPTCVGFWSTAAYWNGNVYMWAASEKTGNVPMLFKMNGGVLDTSPDSKGTVVSQFPSPTFSISSNGAQDGIAWAVRADQFNTHGPAVLYAFDANDLSTPIYESDAKSRDTAGVANKFSVPVVTNGKVYFAARGEVDVYGLLNSQPVVANPDISPNGGNFAAPQTVTLTDSTTSATIYYTLDGTTPTPASKQYSTPLTISTNTTLKAIGTASGYAQSGVVTATFTFSSGNQAPTPTFTPAAGTYSSAQSVTLSDSDASAVIYYTTDGSTPSASSTKYTAAIQVSASETIEAIAIDPADANSNVATAAYVIQTGNASYTLTGTPISISSGGTGTSTITITPIGGFTGNVKLACSLTKSPANAVNLPTCSMAQPAAINGNQGVTATLTVNTTASSASAALTGHPLRGMGGAAALAGLILLWVPRRRRTWQALLGLLLFACVIAGVSGCSSTGSHLQGTTRGAYVMTVTGTSGSLSASVAVDVTVN